MDLWDRCARGRRFERRDGRRQREGPEHRPGPGFDCLGIAITGLGDRVTAESAGGAGVRVRSVSDARIPSDPARNTAALAASEVLRRAEAADLDMARIEADVRAFAAVGSRMSGRDVQQRLGTPLMA